MNATVANNATLLAESHRPASGTIADCIRNGKALSHIPVVDFHTHLGRAHKFYHLPYSTLDEVIGTMDLFGVDHMVTFTFTTDSDCTCGNRYIYDAVRAYPERFTALTALHGAHPGDWIELLEEGAAAGVRGIKLVTQYQGVYEPDVDWTPVFDFAHDRNWVVLHHDWHSSERLALWAGRYANLTFICGHARVTFADVVRDYPNVYVSSCAEFANVRHGSFEQMLAALPVDRILYGSDALDLSFGTAIGPLALLNVDEGIKEKILGGNAVALMKRLGWDIPFLR